jgi:hypothetical protein
MFRSEPSSSPVARSSSPSKGSPYKGNSRGKGKGTRFAVRHAPTLLAVTLLAAPFAAWAQGKPKPAASAAASASSASPAASVATPPPATSSAAPASTLATGSTGTMDAATYSVRLRDLEQRINELKEAIRRSHTRLALLSESILSGITAAARAEITFENDMSSAFRLKRVVALYDGSPLTSKTDEHDQVGDQKEVPLYADLVQPGDHTVQILLEYQGNGYGIFSYLKGYKFEVRSSRSFTAIEGKTLQLRIVGYESGGPTTPLEERPAVRYMEKVRSEEHTSELQSHDL